MFRDAPGNASSIATIGASAPGANELAHELIDTLDPLTVSEQAKECMHDKVDEYEDETLDEIARRADGGDADAEQAMAEFEAALAGCR